MENKHFKVIIEQDEDGIFVASVPALPGCHTQGKTYEEAITRIQEAIELCLQVAKDNPHYNSQITPSPKFIGISEVTVS